MLLARLKRETTHIHQRIESSLDLFRSDFGREDYRRLLRRLYGYYAPWEDHASAAAPDLIAGREKTQWLVSDLIYWGAGGPELLNIECCASLPLLDTAPRVLGSMYVLEGATLGGQILQRHMRSRFGLNGAGCAYFSGYGERTAGMWKQFGEVVEAQPPATHDDIVGSAIATFESLAAWLTGARQA